MPYEVAGQIFPTKADVTAAATAIRDSVGVGDELLGANRDFMLALLEFHSEADDKIRGGVTRLGTMHNAFGTISFQIERSDGTSDDFSIGTCVKGLTKASPLAE